MAALKRLSGVDDLIRHLRLVEGLTYEQISAELKRRYPGVRGLSTRSVRRHCLNESFYRTSRLSNEELDRVIAGSIRRVSFIIMVQVFSLAFYRDHCELHLHVLTKLPRIYIHHRSVQHTVEG